MRRRKNLEKIVGCALFAAVSIVLEVMTTFIPGLNLEMYFGGRVFGISMLPIILISFMYGITYGLLSGALLAVVNVLLSLNAVLSWGLTPEALAGTIILDYLIPFTLLGLAGIFKNGLTNNKEFVLGTLMVCFIRYLCHVLSGFIIFASWTPADMPVWFYSIIAYNLPYMASSTALTLVIGLLVRKSLAKYLGIADQQSLDNQVVGED